MNPYATFWQRLAAGLIDLAVLLPVLVLQGMLEARSRTAALLLVVPMFVLTAAYTLYGHGRFGQTVGKWAMGIRVVRLDHGRIGWGAAWRRSSVDLVMGVLSMVGTLVALTTISDAAYLAGDWMQRARSLEALRPSWLAWTTIASQVWIWSEVVVMLFNKRRRSLHDFIAGTMVVSERRPAAGHVQARPA